MGREEEEEGGRGREKLDISSVSVIMESVRAGKEGV